MRRIDFLLVSTSQEVLKKTEQICLEYNYHFCHLKTIEEVLEREAEVSNSKFILLTTEIYSLDSEIAGAVQVLKQFCSDSCLLVTVSSKLDPAVTVFVKKSGATAVLLDVELKTTSKLEFIASQKIRSLYIPIKPEELFENSSVDFFIYHMMPLNQKFLPLIRPNDAIPLSKIQKIKEIGEVFIKREDIEKYLEYSNKFNDKTQTAFVRRCRARFLNLNKYFIDLVFLLTDQSEHASYKEGELLYQKVKNFADDLLGSLGMVENPWKLVDNTSFGSFGVVERSPAIAVFSTILSLKTGLGNTQEVLMAGLLSDIGLLSLSPEITTHLRKHGHIEGAHAELRKEYSNHPIVSLNILLSRKLPIPESLKQIILSTHEQFDRNGFPSRPRPEKIPVESQLILLCSNVDSKSVVQFGQERPDFSIEARSIVKAETESPAMISPVYMVELKKYL